jgi:hypothetical protein
MKLLLVSSVAPLLLISIATSAKPNAAADLRPRSPVGQKQQQVLTPATGHHHEITESTNMHRHDSSASPVKVLPDLRGGVALDDNLVKALTGALAFAIIEQATKMGLKKANIAYPASLGGCVILFFFLCLVDLVSPSTANSIFQSLTPGAAILAKWFPIFFVPGLALLPLSPPIGGPMDVRMILVVRFLSP